VQLVGEARQARRARWIAFISVADVAAEFHQNC